ncbi:MAG TPA: carbohydrate ABC transporter permease, partial [Hyphomicrobiaceae bacterium]|nr:carbohydrate ABC transporter permease [Hyphomicrobiaceae bacterium]
MTEAAALPRSREHGGAISWESLPRRVVTVYLPLACFVFVLLFPFYWMTLTAL